MQSGDSTTGIVGLYAVERFHDWDWKIVCSREIPRLGWEDCMQSSYSTTGMGRLYAVERCHDWDGRIVCSRVIQRLG